MNEQEQNLADELEQIIKNAQADEGSKTPQIVSAEAELAQSLVQLSQTTNASLSFTDNLRVRLRKRAIQYQTKQNPSEKASFWRDLQHMLKEGFTMKRTYALGAVLALVIFAGLFVLGRGLFNNSTTEVAEVTTIPVATLPETGTETDTAVSPPEELAQLPRFDSQAVGGGSGGGGAEGGSLPVEGDLSMKIANPFSGTNFIMNINLPLEPVNGQVQQRFSGTPIDAALARQLADQYGFNGPLYIETYPSTVPTEGDGAPPVTYIAFDGRRTLRIDPWSINYNDDAAAAKIDYENAQPLPNASVIAETFLQERGQLNFPYKAEVQPWGDVFFYRMVGDTAVIEPEITVSLNPDGEVAFAFDSVSTDWSTPGTYPLITAEQAWQQVLAGVTENRIMYQTIANEQDQPQPVEEPDFLADYQYWAREFTPGTEIHLYDWPQVYRPVAGGSPIVKVRSIVINADDSTLNALIDGRDNQLHLWGILSEDGTQLQLSDWEALSVYDPIFQQGVVTRQGDQVIFQGNEGDTFILPQAPADLTDGLAVNVFGNGTRDTGLAYPVLDWESIDKYIEYPEEPVLAEPPTDSMPTEPFEPFRYEQVQIDTVELAYVVTYLWSEESIVGGDAVVEQVSPTIFLQPAWAFKGTTDNGDTIHLFVQAVDPAYLQP